jgi:DsbC/DsbD-like thiol-disulfide interchange protein
MMRWLVCASTVAILASINPVIAGEDHARPSIVTETDSFAPGRTTFIGIAFDIDDEWHIYWNGRNDTGFEPEITVALPSGYEAGQVLWPAPKRYISDGDILDHIYERTVLLMIPVRVPADAKPGEEVTIEASVDWLVCKDACIPGSAHLTHTIPIAAAGAEPQRSRAAVLFEATRLRLPKPLPRQNAPLTVSPPPSGGDRPAFTLTAAAAGRIAFYPTRNSAPLVDPIADAAGDGKVLNLRLADSEAPRLQGIVEIWPDPGSAPNTSSVWWIDTALRTGAELPTGGAGAAAPASDH